MEKMEIYNKVRSVPETAKRKITGGRLNGKTDINPMWRIKVLTETFGPCGSGWYVQVADKRIEDGVDGVKVAIVDLNLFYRLENGEWSAPVFGTGGNMLVDKERNGLYTSDEAFKMAYTDALSVCCKMLGVAADVYWESDRTKYSGRQEAPAQVRQEKPAEKPAEEAAKKKARSNELKCQHCGKVLRDVKRKDGTVLTAWDIAKGSSTKFGEILCITCARKAEEAGGRIATAPAGPRNDNAPAYDPAYDQPPMPDEGELPPWEAEG